MAYYELSPSAPGRQTPLGLKANLVSALNAALQIQRESAIDSGNKNLVLIVGYE